MHNPKKNHMWRIKLLKVDRIKPKLKSETENRKKREG